ncbi:MAG: efflux RND transporter permease subunit, partial [Candidatus Hydrogenedentes bacterium]|nr:efflux RND transporter permease subunit [Candidatus Hydrogenedentota bacterium]
SRRVDQRRAVIVSASVQGRDLGSVNAEIDERLALLQPSWPKGYFYALGGQNRELQESYDSLMFALLLAIFLVYVVMACQFESIWHPALILFSVPLAFIGVVYVLYWFSISFSVVVLIGGIVLAGIVVNDAIVLVDYINQLRERGRNKIDAVVEAGRVRFRPIMMTTLTTVLGLVPMAISGGEGAEIRGPMAITVMAGLLSATVLTLVIIPLIYTMFAGRDPV